MTQSIVTELALVPARINDRTARALAAEFTRHPGPKSGLLVGAEVGSPLLAAVLDALGPDDTLTVLSEDTFSAPGVEVIEKLSQAKPADVVIVAGQIVGSADDAHDTLAALRGLLNPGGVLSLAVPVLPGTGSQANDEIARQVTAYGVGSDLVLRSTPPLRVHRLRFTPGSAEAAADLAPAYRTSSVPLAGGMNIDSNGVAAFGICVGLAAGAKVLAPRTKLWLLPAALALPVAAFFRDPERTIPEDPSAVVAASDGKVLSVERITDDRFGEQVEWLRIAVFLSVLDVHVNRAPVAGRVVDSFVEDGGFAAAMKPEAEHNVAAYTVLDSTHGRVVVAQRTGLIARRIVRRAPVGSMLAKGERYGLIRFGSRTDVYLPADTAEPLVAPGDRVVGASTVIARWL
ncbi:phosphatidylserine decarboxylase [Longispora sp. K20-0274]|uniref:phosphatidylserine decarboxylase n=1 Tax=Longispora sp. K20-0274 TaxID=3088255 RepID=UPI00399BD154